MGRNAKSAIMQQMEGNPNRVPKEELEARVEAEKALKFDANKIDPPDWLTKEAKAVFRKIVKEFKNSKLLVNVDVYAIALFCDAYDNYIQCTEIIKNDGIYIEGSRNAEAGKVPHPLMPKKIQLAQQMDKLSGKFGLSPVDRAKLVINLQKDGGEDDTGFGDRL